MLYETKPERTGYFTTIGKYAVFIETTRKVINDAFLRDFLKHTSIPINRNLGDDVIISRLKNHPHFKRWEQATCTPKIYKWSEQQQNDWNKPEFELMYDITTTNSFGGYYPNEIDYIIM